MSNLLALMVHCPERGSEAVAGARSHIVLYEGGGAAYLAGVHTLQLPNEDDGTIAIPAVLDAVRADDYHHPVTRVVCVENSQNQCGGVALPAAYTAELAAALPAGVGVHVDGARLVHAAAALGEEPAALVRGAGSVSLCLSKGLAAPVGSVLAGPAPFVAEARRLRKAIGGGMRQAGVLAACGLVALREMAPRAGNDNENARALAAELDAHPLLSVDRLGNPALTNMVFVRADPDALPPAALTAALLRRGVQCVPFDGAGRTRLVLHYEVAGDAVPRVADAFREAAAEVAVQ